MYENFSKFKYHLIVYIPISGLLFDLCFQVDLIMDINPTPMI